MESFTDDQVNERLDSALKVLSERAEMSTKELVIETVKSILTHGKLLCEDDCKVMKAEGQNQSVLSIASKNGISVATTSLHAHPDFPETIVIIPQTDNCSHDYEKVLIDNFSNLVGVARNQNIILMKSNDIKLAKNGITATLLGHGSEDVSSKMFYEVISRCVNGSLGSEDDRIKGVDKDFDSDSRRESVISMLYFFNVKAVSMPNTISHQSKKDVTITSDLKGSIDLRVIYNKVSSDMSAFGGKSCIIQFKNPKQQSDVLNAITNVYKDCVTDAIYSFEIKDKEMCIITCKFIASEQSITFSGMMQCVFNQKKLDNLPLKELYQKLHDQYSEQFDKFKSVSEYSLKYGIEGGLEQRRKEYKDLYKDMDRLITDLSYLKTRTAAINREMELLAKGKHGINFDGKIDIMKQNHKIKLVSFTLNGNPIPENFDPQTVTGVVEMNVFTNNIYINHKGKWYDIGTFHISITLTPDSARSAMKYKLKIFNTKHSIDGFWSNSQHPHVDGDGIPCQGDAVSSITDALAAYDFVSVVMICVNYVSSFNPSDPAGATITSWPIVSEEEAYNSDSDVSVINADKFLKVRNEEINTLQSAFDSRSELNNN